MEKYNTFLKRFLATVIDALILIPITLLEPFIRRLDNIYLLTTALFLVYCSPYIYSVIFHWTTGQTFGKYCMNVRVVDKTEYRLLNFKQSFLRDSIYIILQIIGFIVIAVQLIHPDRYSSEAFKIENYLESLGWIWFLLEIGTMLTNKKRRSLHDLMAGSVVIKDEFWHTNPEPNTLQPPT